MACFLVPLAQAIATSIYRKCNEKSISDPSANAFKHQVPALEKMLWGGTLMLVVDHIASGELTWRFPFFTALGQAGGWEIMWREMLAVGVPMALAVTGVWAVYALIKKRQIVRVARNDR